MSREEYLDWKCYRDIRGSLNIAKRLDTAMTLNRYKHETPENRNKAIKWEHDIVLEEDLVVIDNVVNIEAVKRFELQQEEQDNATSLISKIVYRK